LDYPFISVFLDWSKLTFEIALIHRANQLAKHDLPAVGIKPSNLL